MKTPIYNTGYIKTYLENNVIVTDYTTNPIFDKPYINQALIDNVVIEGIEEKDYPDFCDAFVSSADYDGEPMTDEMIDRVNDDSDLLYDLIQKQLF